MTQTARRVIVYLRPLRGAISTEKRISATTMPNAMTTMGIWANGGNPPTQVRKSDMTTFRVRLWTQERSDAPASWGHRSTGVHGGRPNLSGRPPLVGDLLGRPACLD